MPDPFNLQRFVQAQDAVVEQVLSELRAGKKRSHWMWFVFPQIQGLGHSDMATRYAIASLDEARAYLGHPVLGERLKQCTRALNAVRGRSAEEILGYPDVLKFQSSMTLFAAAAPHQPEFTEALEKYYAGERDAATLQRIEASRDVRS